MPLVKMRYVMEQLSVSRGTVENLVARGELHKHYLPVTGCNPKRRPVRFDSNEVERFKLRVMQGQIGPAKGGVVAGGGGGVPGGDADLGGRAAGDAPPPRSTSTTRHRRSRVSARGRPPRGRQLLHFE